MMDAAHCTLDVAQDAKEFGDLQHDPLNDNEMAFVMKYSSEDRIWVTRARQCRNLK